MLTAAGRCPRLVAPTGWRAAGPRRRSCPSSGGERAAPRRCLTAAPPTAERDRVSAPPEPATRVNSGESPDDAILAAFGDHLALERNLSRHTVRAYLGDVAGMLDHARRMGIDDIGGGDLRPLGAWLGGLPLQGGSQGPPAPRSSPAPGVAPRAPPRGVVPAPPRA